jgi:putative endonuclease|tara:strand:- start:4777 stop:5073 length:297 start_codon:yes stop_codon:yes gene_type:complete
MSKNLFYVYILHCGDDSYYTGITNSLERRVEEHVNGYGELSYTHNRQPVKVVYSEIFQWVEDAIKREKQIKGWTRNKKEALISQNFKLLKQLSKKKFK